MTARRPITEKQEAFRRSALARSALQGTALGTALIFVSIAKSVARDSLKATHDCDDGAIAPAMC